MKRWYTDHQQEFIQSPWGYKIEIDCNIVKLIQRVWRLGIETAFSCENNEGMVDVGVNDAATAVRYWAAANYTSFPSLTVQNAVRRRLERICDCMEAEEETISSHLPQCELVLNAGPGTIAAGHGWTFQLFSKPILIYCRFPVENLLSVTANLQCALPLEALEEEEQSRYGRPVAVTALNRPKLPHNHAQDDL